MKRSLRLAAPLALVLGLSVLTGTPTAAGEESASVDRPERLLAKPTAGSAAVRALGADLGEAARRNGMSAERFQSLLAGDSSATVYPTGELAYVDVRDELADVPTEQALIVPEGQTFTLHSRAGSKHTIFLNFQGAFVGDTLWNDEDDIPAKTYDAFSLDANFGSYSTAEHEYIQEVWRVVSETYATFDVDVTTQNPGVGAYNRNGPTDPTYGDQVLFTDDPDSNPVCEPPSCGGVAFVDTFDNTKDNQNYYEPAWVRTFNSATNAGIAAAHEVGHTLGLFHDGRAEPKEAYYQGHGAWTPIMGSGPNAIQQFSKGEYANANNKQDDLATIVATGLPTIPDDAGNTIATATTLGARATYAVDGVITNSADQDVYRIGPCTGPITVAAHGTGVASALDLRVDVYDGAGTSLGSQNPPSGQTAGLPHLATGVDVPAFSPSAASTYFVKVDGVGSGSPATTGYSDYGSIGSYTLDVSGCAAANGTPPGAPTDVDFTNTKSAGTVSWTAPVLSGSSAISGYRISGLPGGPVEVPAGTTSKNVTVPGGRDVFLSVVALNASGPGAGPPVPVHLKSWAPTTPPTIKVTTTVLTAKIAWALGANPGGAAVVAWRLKESSKTTDLPMPDFQYGVNVSYNDYGTHTVTITPLVHTDDGSTSPGRSVTYAIATKPSAPRIGTASSGARGRPVTATARWAASHNGGAKITAYKVVAYRVNSRGAIVSSKVSRALSGSARAYAFPLAAGRYRFRVVAYNLKGASPGSSYSRIVTAR